MRIRGLDLWLAIVVLLGATLWPWAYYDANCQCYGDRKDCEAQWGWGCELVGTPASAVAVLGLIVTVIGIAYISRQVKQGRDGIAASRESVDLQRQGERGRMIYW